MKLFWVVALALLSSNALASFDIKTTIPKEALPHIPVLKSQIKELWPDMPEPAYFGALIEHESGCPIYKKMCWNAKARLKTDREEGAGLGQLTKAYRPDGSTRFDSLQEARNLDRKGLNELRWETVYDRPDLQMRVIVLMVRQSWNRLSTLVPDYGPRLHMVDAAYNGGVGGVMNERRACSMTPHCIPNLWFGNVEKTCLKSKKPIYGKRSACDINRHHVEDVTRSRLPKYREIL
jgi:hypothetical protein